MAEDTGNDSRPIPDPTLLTTEQLFREVERLKEYVEALRSTDREAVKLAADEREKAASALREQLTLRVESGDTNLREHISAQIAQIHAALLSADELERARVDAVSNRLEELNKAGHATVEARIAGVQREVGLVHEASERAIEKAEKATEKRFESVNEFRAQLAAQTNAFLPREVAESQFDAMNKRLGVLESASRYQEGQQKGVGMSAGVLVGGLGALATIITIIVVLANVVTAK